jgi:hypothetical protein
VWEWAEKPHESFLMIDAEIHYPIMELLPEDRRDRAKVHEAVGRLDRGAHVHSTVHKAHRAVENKSWQLL